LWDERSSLGTWFPSAIVEGEMRAMAKDHRSSVKHEKQCTLRLTGDV
jgi:hypothetical protein